MMHKNNGCIIAVVLIGAMLLISACHLGTSKEPSPIEVIKALEAAVNANDLKAVESLFTEDAVEFNGGTTYVGAALISQSYQPIIMEESLSIRHANIHQAGDTVEYDWLVFDRKGRMITGSHYEAVVVAGKIKSNIYTGKATSP